MAHNWTKQRTTRNGFETVRLLLGWAGWALVAGAFIVGAMLGLMGNEAMQLLRQAGLHW